MEYLLANDEGVVMDRRTFLKLSGAGALVVGSGISLTSCAVLQPPDENGLRLLPGFTSRKIATTNQVVPGTTYTWHPSPDGGAVFPTDDGGWIYVSNAETFHAAGGASMVRFAGDGTVIDAKRILGGTLFNCAGGATPWGTWLSCEEHSTGQVWECDPYGVEPAEARPAMGAFKHEAAAVDEAGRAIYLTEDEPNGAFYRFRPAAWGDVSAGVLEVMTEIGGTLGWATVPDPSGALGPLGPTRDQVPGTKRFAGGEGTVFVNGSICFTTKFDNRVWRYTPGTNTLVIVYDASTSSNPVLTGVDNITARPNGELFVAEDPGTMDIVRIRTNGSLERFLSLDTVSGSEIAGPAFTPDQTRLYFSSQRNPGETFEVKGPF